MYHARRNALIDALARSLPEATIGGAAAGLHLIAWLPDPTDESAVRDAAAERGVAILTLHRDCVVAATFGPALLLGYGMIDESVIPRAVQELATAVGQ
jgi:GntR family transcriptional regulator / MocR family aminotransferase